MCARHWTAHPVLIFSVSKQPRAGALQPSAHQENPVRFLLFDVKIKDPYLDKLMVSANEGMTYWGQSCLS